MCKVIDRPETEADTFPEIPEAIKQAACAGVCVCAYYVHMCVHFHMTAQVLNLTKD